MSAILLGVADSLASLIGNLELPPGPDERPFPGQQTFCCRHRPGSNSSINYSAMLLKNKYAVISGAATENGIGYATARLFAENGATVALLDLERNSPPKKAAFLVKTIGDTSAT